MKQPKQVETAHAGIPSPEGTHQKRATAPRGLSVLGEISMTQMRQTGECWIGINPHMDRQAALDWASRRWGCNAIAGEHAHPTSIGDTIATLLVVDRRGQQYRGIGYSSMAPLGWSVWYKAALDLLGQEPAANVEVRA